MCKEKREIKSVHVITFIDFFYFMLLEYNKSTLSSANRMKFHDEGTT